VKKGNGGSIYLFLLQLRKDMFIIIEKLKKLCQGPFANLNLQIEPHKDFVALDRRCGCGK
jgi:hypothetical protein